MTLEDLDAIGIVAMDADQIDGFLTSQSVGVLGLPTDGPPMLRPMSFWYDGAGAVYFLYVLGAASEKARSSELADVARFLVYRAETAFNWRSVILTGPIERVPADRRDDVLEAMDIDWRPEIFEREGAPDASELYRLTIEEREGVKHLGLPPGFESSTSAGDDSD